MESDLLFPAQKIVLQAFGFTSSTIELTSKSRPKWFHLKILLFTIAVALILGGFFACFHEIIIIPYALAGYNDRTKSILEVLAFFPFVSESLRGPIVLTIYLTKRGCLSDLSHTARNLMDRCLHGTVAEKQLVRSCRKLSVILAVATFTATFLWTYFEWLLVLEETDFEELKWTMDYVVYESPLNLTAKQYVLNMILFEALPFFLSQQVVAVVINLAVVLTAMIKKVNGDLQEMSQTLPGNDTRLPVDTWVAETEKRLTTLQQLHLDLLLFCHELNDTFGLILFTAYGLDVVTLIGFVANLVTGKMVHTASYLMNFSSMIIFGAYTTVFFFPFVSAYEKGLQISFSLHQLIITSRSFLQSGKTESKIRNTLRTFHTASMEQLFLFSGAEIMQFTRGFLVQTFTLALSFAVLAYEVFEKTTKSAAPCSSFGNTGTNSTNGTRLRPFNNTLTKQGLL